MRPSKIALTAAVVMLWATTVAPGQSVTSIPISRPMTLDGLFALPNGELLGASAWNGSSLWKIGAAGEMTELATGLYIVNGDGGMRDRIRHIELPPTADLRCP